MSANLLLLSCSSGLSMDTRTEVKMDRKRGKVAAAIEKSKDRELKSYFSNKRVKTEPCDICGHEVPKGMSDYCAICLIKGDKHVTI